MYNQSGTAIQQALCFSTHKTPGWKQEPFKNKFSISNDVEENQYNKWDLFSYQKEHYLRPSFSGGGKVEASPLSLEIVSADAPFVPRMFKVPPVSENLLQPYE